MEGDVFVKKRLPFLLQYIYAIMYVGKVCCKFGD